MPQPESDPKPAAAETATPTPWFKRLKIPTSRKGRVLLAVSTLVMVSAVLLAIPYTRYGFLGQVVKKPITVEVTDSRTRKPVSDALIQINGKKLKTDAKGRVEVAGVPVGGWQLSADKKYYNLLSSNIMVPLFGKQNVYKLSLSAIGNQVTVKVINKITGQPLAKAGIAALGTTATTDANGEAVIVLPAQKAGEPGALKLSGYNDRAVTIQNTEALTAANTFALTPAGKLYFLSKRTGKIDVMKSDLDGATASVVLAGTGREDDSDTVLLATRDWKFLALKSRRDSANAKLYVIDTATDKLDTIDTGNVTFAPAGWSGHDFVFSLNRNDVKYWQPKQTALKTYDADKDSLKTIDETDAVGADQNNYLAQNIGNSYLIDDAIVYTKQWNGGSGSGLYEGKKASIISASLATGARNTLKEFDAKSNLSINATLYEAKHPVFKVGDYDTNIFSFYEFENGKVSPTTEVTVDTFDKFYPTYIQSPSGKQTFWYEPRDGKNTLFSGDEDGGNSKQLAGLSDFTPYGWYSDDYILLSKNKSELYIAPKDLKSAPLKVTDYHKPNFNSNGYGGGYGGF